MTDNHTPHQRDDDASRHASLRESALAGVRWYAVVRVLAEAGGFATSVVLAHLIAPAEFGSVAIAFGIVSLAGGMLGSGLTAPLVQRREIGRAELEATSFLSLAAAALLVCVFVVLVPLVSEPLFGAPATHLIQLAAVALPFTALGVVPTAQLQRRLAFRQLSSFDLISQLSGAAVSVGAAVLGAGGKAIIYGAIFSSMVQTLMLCRSAPLARPAPHRRAIRDLLGFGASAGMASVVYSAYQNIDYVIIGARLGTAELGYYWRAFQLGVEYQGKVSRIMLQLAFPIYSRLDDLDAIRRMRARIVRVHASVLFPALMLLAAVAPVLIPFLYGDRWSQAVLPTQILSIAGLTAVVATGGGPLLLAAGKPRWLLGVNVIALTLFSIVVYFTAPLGIVAVCLSVAAYQVAVLTALQLLMRRLLGIPASALIRDVGPALMGSLALFAVALGLTKILDALDVSPALLLPVVGLASVGTYAVVMRYAFRGAWADLMLLARTVVPVKRTHVASRSATSASPRLGRRHAKGVATVSRVRVIARLRYYAHRIRYLGRRVYCPVCEQHARRFAPHRGRPHARCVHCGSLERHRVLWLWLRERVPPRSRLLHVAPEPGLARRLQALPIDYLSVDLDSPFAMMRCDITAIPQPDASFDVLICNHVLEHIPDDRRAMTELRRVLRRGGLAVLQHPIHDRPDTYEDPTVVEPDERLRVFGQEDHVRIYGWDMLDRLRTAGFEGIETPEPCDEFSKADRKRFGLEPSPTIIAH